MCSGGRNPLKRRLFSESGMRCADFEDFLGAAAAAVLLFEGKLGFVQDGIYELLELVGLHMDTYVRTCCDLYKAK